MSKPKHTPGPFTVEREFLTTTQSEVFSIYGPARNGWEKTYIGEVLINKGFPAKEHETTHEAEANAQLFAAAPEMLGALKLARRAVSDIGVREIMDAAIAKAEGKESEPTNTSSQKKVN